VMDLSLIHQKNTTLVGSILYRFCDFRWPSHSAAASAACRDCVQHVLSSTWIPNLGM
jgi:hypothetical protein